MRRLKLTTIPLVWGPLGADQTAVDVVLGTQPVAGMLPAGFRSRAAPKRPVDFFRSSFKAWLIWQGALHSRFFGMPVAASALCEPSGAPDRPSDWRGGWRCTDSRTMVGHLGYVSEAQVQSLG